MHSTDVLMGEHRIIEGVLISLESLAMRLNGGEAIPASVFLAAADFIRNFADGHHHQKEEGILFERLVANGMPRDMGPVGVMLAEHEEGRRLTRAMREAAEHLAAGDATAAAQVSANALGYVALLRDHIAKEDGVLFPMSGQIIPAEQHAAVTDAFMQHAASNPGVTETYRGVADELARIAGR